ncbi:hypothetical protein D3C85_224540 [compost metagenome]
MQTRPEPHIDARTTQRRRQVGLPHQRTPGRVSRHARRRFGGFGFKLRPHQAPQAVGAHQRLALPRTRIGARDADEVVAGLDLADARGRDQRARALRAHGIEQQRVQVGAVHAAVRRAVALLHGIAQRHAGQFGAAAGAVDHQRLGARRDGREAAAEVELLKAAGGVGAELHAGADFAEVGGLFEDVGAVMGAGQRQRRGQPSDPAPGDEDVRGHRTQRPVLGVVEVSAGLLWLSAGSAPAGFLGAQLPQLSHEPQPEVLASEAAS